MWNQGLSILAMTRIPCVWFIWSQLGLESMGLLGRAHCLGSVVPLGKELFIFNLSDPIFLEKIKIPLSLEFYPCETRSFILSRRLWGDQSENVPPTQFKGRKKSSHILYSDSVSQKMSPVIWLSHKKSSEYHTLSVVLPCNRFLFSWRKLRWRMEE